MAELGSRTTVCGQLRYLTLAAFAKGRFWRKAAIDLAVTDARPFLKAHLYGVDASRNRRHQTNEFDQDRRMIPDARFPIGTTFPSLRGTRDTTAALARSSKAVAMYFA